MSANDIIKLDKGGIKMKIITFTAIKGGVGKTTLTLNYGDWLAKHGKKVLLIDLDHQCNLTTVLKRLDETILSLKHLKKTIMLKK